MKRIIVCLVACLLLIGCGTLRQFTIDVSEEEVKNYEAAQVVAENYHKIWPMQSGFIRAALGPRLAMLPAATLDAMKELDDICGKDFAELTDSERGASLGLRVRSLNEIVLESLRAYAPDVWLALTSIWFGGGI